MCVLWYFPGHTEFSGKVILDQMVETDLVTVRVLHTYTYVKHTEIHSSFDNRVTITRVVKWDWISKIFFSKEKEGEAFVLCFRTG